jgi:thiamine biosynthesis lipoprotein
VFLEEEGMGIDLGGIAKGYAADISVDYLMEQGVDYGIINFGGNVYAFGEKYDSESWRIGIQAPGENRGSYVGIAEIRDKAVVTSGKYERYFVQDGVRYHHILSTEDGYPVRNGLASVTVITDRSLDADALSTLLFTLGLEEGIRRAEELEDVEAVFLTEEKIVYTTGGLREEFTISEDGYKRGEAKSLLAD